MRKILMLLLPALLHSAMVNGQSPPGGEQTIRDFYNRLSLSWGPGHYAVQDQIFSPFVNQDVSLMNIQLKYTRKKMGWEHQVWLNYSGYNALHHEPYSFLISGEEVQTPRNFFTMVSLDYSLLREWLIAPGKLKLLAGGTIANNILAASWSYGRTSTFGYLASFGPEASASLLWHPWQSGTTLKAHLSVPLFSWVARSPYLANDDEFIENIYSHSGLSTFFAYIGDGRLQTWNRLQGIRLSAGIHHPVGRRFQIGAEWELAMLRHTKPLTFISMNNKLILTGSYNF